MKEKGMIYEYHQPFLKEHLCDYMNVKMQCSILEFHQYWKALKQMDCVTDDSVITLIKNFHTFNFITAPTTFHSEESKNEKLLLLSEIDSD